MSTQTDIHWTLHRGEVLVGTIIPGPPRDEFPFPWQWGTFTPASGYEAIKDLFVEGLRGEEEDSAEPRYCTDSQYRFWQELKRRGIRLQRHPDGETFTVFSLHIDGSIAWWST